MLGGVLLVAVADPLRSFGSEVAAGTGPRRLTRAEITLLALLTVGGGLVRFLELDHLPPGGFYDEVEYHRIAEEILAGDRPIFVPDIQLPAFFVYLLAAGIAVAGRGLATVRGVAALLGTLTLPVFYLLARRAFARPVAAAAAILLAGSRWHITFSRVVFSAAIIAPLLEVLAILFFWRAAERGRRLDYVLLGLVVGIGLQTYYAFNLFPAVLVVATLCYAGREGRRHFWPGLLRIVRGLLWSALAAAVLLAPLARFALRNPEVFFERSSTVAIWNPAHHLPWPGALWQNIVSHLLMFQFQGDANPRHNIPEAPLLNPFEGILFALGLGLTVARGTRWPHATWFGWFAVMLLPAVLTIEAPQAHRAVGAIPALYLLIGEGLQGVFLLATKGARKARTVLAAALLATASVAMASADVWRYFRVQVVHPLAWPAFQADYHAVARFIEPFAERDDIRVSSLFYDYPILRFHLGDDFPYRRFWLSEELPRAVTQRESRTEGTLYVLEPFQRELFPLFHGLYPHARLEEHRDPFGRLMFASIFVPRADLEHPLDPQAGQRGFLGAYYLGDWQGSPLILRREPAVLFHFHWERDALPGSFTADWAADLSVEQPGAYTFRMMATGPSVLLVDDETVIETNEFDEESPREGSLTLSPGHHRIVIRYAKGGYFSTIWLLWRPPSGEFSVIPLRLLRPLPEEEYIRLRERLPIPQTR